MPEDSRTQAEEIIIRFKTARPRGLLLATSLENSADHLQIYLEEGKAQVQIHIGDREKVRLHAIDGNYYFNSAAMEEKQLNKGNHQFEILLRIKR